MKRYFAKAFEVVDSVYRNKQLLDGIIDSDLNWFRNFLGVFSESVLIYSADQCICSHRLPSVQSLKKMMPLIPPGNVRSLVLADLFDIYLDLLLALGSPENLRTAQPGALHIGGIRKELEEHIEANQSTQKIYSLNAKDRNFFKESARVALILRNIILEIQKEYTQSDSKIGR